MRLHPLIHCHILSHLMSTSISIREAPLRSRASCEAANRRSIIGKPPSAIVSCHTLGVKPGAVGSEPLAGVEVIREADVVVAAPPECSACVAKLTGRPDEDVVVEVRVFRRQQVVVVPVHRGNGVNVVIRHLCKPLGSNGRKVPRGTACRRVRVGAILQNLGPAGVFRWTCRCVTVTQAF